MTRRNPNAGPSKARYDWADAVEMALAGVTQAEVARTIGCSRTAVKAWANRHGVTFTIKMRSTLDRYGCSRDEARRLNGGANLNTPGSASSYFRDAFKGAAVRGISWEMTFPEWLAVWDAAGGLHQRGRSPNELCMARHGDIGPYRIGNVSIITARQNAQDRWKNKPFATRRRPISGTAQAAA